MTKHAQKEHGIVFPSTMVHISTLPLKLASKQKKEKKEKKEAVSASSQIAQLRPSKKKESAVRIGKHSIKLKESNNSPFSNHSFQVILIQEGMGNFKDGFFYTKECLQKAVESGLFEGVQCYADHPTEIEEQIQPERSTRDILGYYEKVNYLENDEKIGQLVANLNVANSISLDWAMSLLTNSINYSKKFREGDLVGLSINASGSASPVGIDEFIQSQTLSPTIQSKLQEAKAQGVTEIQVVSELRDATSVDLVTKAGAGGKILQMLEMEKSMSTKRKVKESEGESHKEDGAKDASAMAPGKSSAMPADGATPDHADADQDQALFAKMIKQYLGKDDADEEEMEMAKQAYQCHSESGMEPQEAYEAAGHHLKMAMAIGKKMAAAHQAESESESEESESEGDSMEAQTPPPAPTSSAPKASEKKKESQSMVIALSGEVAKLRESLKRYELKDYLDQKMKECGKSNSVTKKFREALGTPKTKEQIDQTWKLFVKAFDAGIEEVNAESEGFMPEKSNYKESDQSGRGISFNDCLR